MTGNLRLSLVEAWLNRRRRAIAVLRAAAAAPALFKPDTVAQAEAEADHAYVEAQERSAGR